MLGALAYDSVPKARRKAFEAKLAPIDALMTFDHGFVMFAPLDVVSKQRPRHGKGYTYTPKETVEFAESVREAWLDQCGFMPFGEHSDKWMTFDLWCGISRMSRDFDNLAKAVADALNGVAYVDDAQIVRSSVSKAPASPALFGLRVRLANDCDAWAWGKGLATQLTQYGAGRALEEAQSA